MTFKQLQDEVIALRFDESLRASVKSWLNTRYGAIWNMGDWHFKHVTASPWTVSAGDQSPAMFSDFVRSEGLFNEDGDRVPYFDQEVFEQDYLPITSPGSVEAYTDIDGQIYVAPTPSSSRQFYLSYERRLSHVDGPSGLAAAGVMVNDSDQPIWEAEYDYALIIDALILGKQLLGDPTWQDQVPQRDDLIAGMRRQLSAGRGERGQVEEWGSVWCP